MIRRLKDEKGVVIGVFNTEDISNIIQILRDGRWITLINPKDPQAEEIIYDFPVAFIADQLFPLGQ
jgi:hypothetical protein